MTEGDQLARFLWNWRMDKWKLVQPEAPIQSWDEENDAFKAYLKTEAEAIINWFFERDRLDKHGG